MKPVVNGLEKSWKSKVNFLLLDVDTPEGRDAVTRLQATGIPAFYFLGRDGKISETLLGVIPATEMESKLKALSAR